MQTIPLRLCALVAALCCAALVALAAAAWLAPIRLTRAQLPLTAILGLALLLARCAPMPLARGQRWSVGTAPLFAVTLLLPAPLALGLALAAVMAAACYRRVPWFQTVFAGGAVVLEVSAGLLVALLVGARAPFTGMTPERVLAAACLTAFTMYVVNAGLVELVQAVQYRRIVAADVWHRRRFDVSGEAGLFAVGLLVAVLAAEHLWAVLLLAFPTLAIHRTLRASLRYQEQLVHRADHDELTGLGNRSLFTEAAQQALTHTARTQGTLTVLFLDIDGFKRINDTLGHGIGDDLLITIARRLLDCAHPGDTVARLGGDEFIILRESSAPAEAAEYAERLLAAVRTPVVLAGREIVVDASIGIIQSTGQDNVEDLLRSADIAMYQAKAKGKGRYEFFAVAMAAAVQDRVALEMELHRALEQDQFCLYYQPTVELATGRIVGCEALVRWRHPVHGLVPPGRFIPVTEETGMIVPLGRWILREACRQARRWQQHAPALWPLNVSVNLSTRQLQEPGIVADVAAILADTGLSAESLILEITESTMMQDAEAALRALQALKALGVRLALDDFGTGYSSLSYLHRFPFDLLKVDQSFVAGLNEDSEHAKLAATIVRMGRDLRLQIVAEGLERHAQVEALRLLGCEYGQGYYFAHPLPAEAIDDLLQHEWSRPVESGRTRELSWVS